MKSMMAGVAGALVLCSGAQGELVIFETPAGLPFVWTPEPTIIEPPSDPPVLPLRFDPFLPWWQAGDSPAGIRQRRVQGFDSVGTIDLEWLCPVGDAVAVVPVVEFAGFVRGGMLHFDWPKGEYNRPRSFAPGSAVGPEVQWDERAIVGWTVDPTGGGGVDVPLSRTYMTLGAEDFESHTLPDAMTIGLRLVREGQTHFGWADVRWSPDTGTGQWVVERWAYESVAGAPALVPPVGCAGDANGDGVTDGADLSVLLAQFGQSVTAGTGADFNGDGVVNGADLSALLSGFGCG